MRYTQYAICDAWLARTYRDHKSTITVERSPDHVRYLFHAGDGLPLYSLHSMKVDGLLREFYRAGATMKARKVGRPFVVLYQYPSKSKALVKVWTGQYWQVEIMDLSDSKTFGLYLTTGRVGVVWGAECQ